MNETNETREAVRARYAGAALRVLQPGERAETVSGCCGTRTLASATTATSEQATASTACCAGSACSTSAADPITGSLYSSEEVADLPTDAVAVSLGCGNPTALAELRPGEVVLDLGSGGGIDVLLSAKRVGPSGTAYGLDMTDEMLELARRNATAAGAINVEFLKGEIENVPLPDASVDVVISNCVINLSTDKGRVLREAFRVLKPGGRFAVSDVVVDGPVPDELRRQVELWVGCIAGALDRREYQRLLEEAGFQEVTMQPTRFYAADDLQDEALGAWLQTRPDAERTWLNRAFMSAFVRATKPGP